MATAPTPTPTPDPAASLVTAHIPLPPPFTNTDPPPTLLTQGAEALIYRTHFLLPSHPCALKHRPPKPYRHPTLDGRLTRHRVLGEARALVKCRREGVPVPGVLGVGWEVVGGGGWMLMEWVEGKSVREFLMEKKGRGKGMEEENAGEVRGLMGRIGRAVGKLHEIGVVHGDLTTSNLMVREHGGEIVLIDFGLAVQSVQEEDKAVDLYVLERAFGSTHPEAEAGFREVLEAYEESYRGGRLVLKRLEEVRMRGRKRSMLG